MAGTTDNNNAKKKQQRLGKGLNSLITNKLQTAAPATADPSSDKEGRKTVPIDKIERNKKQPRKTFNEESISELAESIKQKGVLIPLLVVSRGDHYEIVAGERRWRAAKKAGLKEVPVEVRELSEQEIAEIAIIENIQREDLNPIEEAQAYKSLKDEFGYTDDEVAMKVSKSRVAVTNSMRLLKLDERVRQMVSDGKLSTGHVRPLIVVEDTDKQAELAQTAVDMKLSVREVEKLVKTFRSKPKEKTKNDFSAYQLQYDEYAGKLTEKIGSKASVVLTDKDKGKLEIEFYGSDAFEALYTLLMKQQ